MPNHFTPIKSGVNRLACDRDMTIVRTGRTLSINMSRLASTTRPRASRAAAVKPPRPGTLARRAVFQEIPIDRIDLPRQPVRRFLGDIAALADSMQEYGLQQPISVREAGDRFQLTSGLRRVSAARLLRWTTIPAFVRSLSQDDAYLVDLVENLQRQDLSPDEEADAFTELIRTRSWTLQEVADAVKRSVAYVSKRVRVFSDALLREAVVQRGLPISTAEELLGGAPEQRSSLIEQALTERWDQVQARDALHPLRPELPEGDGYAERPQPRGRKGGLPGEDGQQSDSSLAQRPPGFTRAIRDFHRVIIAVRADELTSGDRAALRALFRDLVLLARAPTAPTARVFPALPAAPASSVRVARKATPRASRRSAR